MLSESFTQRKKTEFKTEAMLVHSYCFCVCVRLFSSAWVKTELLMGQCCFLFLCLEVTKLSDVLTEGKKSNFCFIFLFLATVKLCFYVLCTASVPHLNIPSLLTGFNRRTIKYLLCRSSILQFWCDFQTVAYTSDPSMSINPFPVGESLPINSSSSFMCFILPLSLPRVYFCSVSSYFCAPRCIDNFQQKYDFSLFYRAKNLIAESSIQLCFARVENNKQGGGLRSRRSPWDYCSKEIWYDYRKQ